MTRKIASQQLPRIRSALDPLHNARQQLSLVLHFVRTTRMREMRLSASIRKNCQEQNQNDPETKQNRGGNIVLWTARQYPRPPQDGLAVASFQSGARSLHCKGGHDAHQRIACSARDETPLIPDAWQKNETCQERTERSAHRIKQGRDRGAVHPVIHSGLHAYGDRWKQNSRDEGDREH